MNEFLLPWFTALAAYNLIPRLAPGRAVCMLLQSRFAFKPVPASQRSREIKQLQTMMNRKDFGQGGYLVVTGEQGIGKTTLIHTVVTSHLRRSGVVRVTAYQPDSEERILEKVMCELTGSYWNLSSPFIRAKRVIEWHRVLTGHAPLVILHGSTEREKQQDHIHLPGVIQKLIQEYKLRIIVDASRNSLHPSLLQMPGANVMEVQPMTRDMIWQMPHLQELFTYINETRMGGTVFAVLGGIPSHYDAFWDHIKFELRDGKNARQVIGKYLTDVIFDAIGKKINTCIETHDMVEIIKLFDKDKQCVRWDTLMENKLQRPVSDHVFRQEMRDGICVLVPACHAMGIVLRHRLTMRPTLSELEKLLE